MTNERIVQFRVGVTVVAAALIAAILVVLFDGFPNVFRQRKYVVYVTFDQAPGISEGTPVRRSGILIGRVAKVDFAEDLGMAPKPNARVIVTVQVDGNRVVRNNEVPQIGKSLLGDAVLEFVLQERAHDDSVIPEGGTIEGRVISDPLQAIGNIEGNLSIAISSIAGTADEIGRLAKRVNDLIANNDEQMIRIVGKAELTLDQLQVAVRNANDMLGDPMLRDNVRRVAGDLPKAMDELNRTLTDVRQTFQTVNRNFQNLEGITKPLGERGSELVDSLGRASQTLDVVLRDVQAFSAAINSPNGSLGRLINDDRLYDELNSVVTNINDISRDLKPIVRDARAFTDKVSRHPEKLGVRGALFPSSGIK